MAASGVELFTMNEVNWLEVIQNVVDQRLNTRLTAELHDISERQYRH